MEVKMDKCFMPMASLAIVQHKVLNFQPAKQA